MNERTIFFVFAILFLGFSMFLAGRIEKFLPKLFSVVSAAKVMWPLALGLNLLDVFSTWLCLAHSGRTDTEGNPLFRFIFEQFGVGMGLFVGKVFFVSIFIILFLKIASLRTRLVFLLFFFTWCVNNFAGFLLAGPA